MSNELSISTQTASGNLATINPESESDRLMLVAAVNAAESLNDYVAENGTDAVIRVRNIFTMDGIRKGRGQGQGDVPCKNTYLVTTDGLSLMTQSDGIYRSACAIVAAFPTLELEGEDGFPVRVQTKQLRNGNTIKSLVPCKG